MTTDREHLAAARRDVSDRLASGFTDATKAERKQAAAAAAFKPSPELDRLIELRDTDPAAYAALPTHVRLNVGFYESDQARAGGDLPSAA